MIDSKYVILVIEDEPAIRDAIIIKLNRKGFVVLEAKNGQEGLDIALQKHPDLILLDIIMPIMDGFTVIEKLKKDEWGKNAPILLLTNLSDSETISESMKVNRSDFLIKSDWTLEEVVKKINQKLNII
ncbi:MAG: response regulator [Patescibacteria group bacterium]|nr:response regulator [Patescibacteria group bacterium]MDD5164252.1 response regulator [Patescibacteria group bacterium]MDD5534702.1 response regulator [Patescibacteria group bacterium]